MYSPERREHNLWEMRHAINEPHKDMDMDIRSHDAEDVFSPGRIGCSTMENAREQDNMYAGNARVGDNVTAFDSAEFTVVNDAYVKGEAAKVRGSKSMLGGSRRVEHACCWAGSIEAA